MKLIILNLVGLLSLGACQLPPRTGVSINQIPTMSTKTIIDSNNGLLSGGISKVPGSICVLDKDGKCDPINFVPTQCLTNSATVEVKPITNPQPAYHSLINDKYKSTASLPFVAPSASAEYLDEIKAVISGEAQINSKDLSNGYPGIDGIKTCISKAYGRGDYGSVYWISAANIIAVTNTNYLKVSSSSAVTGTGFGANGSTYNNNGVDAESVWIGIFPHLIKVGSVPGPEKPSLQPAKVISSTVSPTTEVRTTVVQPKRPPEPLPPATTEPIPTTTQPK